MTYIIKFSGVKAIAQQGYPHCAMLCAEYDTVICHICHLFESSESSESSGLRRMLLIIHIGLVKDALRLVFLNPSTLLPLREQIARGFLEVGY